MVIEQVSQRIDPEVHSRRIRGPQGPDPPAFPYLAETWVYRAFADSEGEVDWYTCNFHPHVMVGLQSRKL